MRTPPKAFSRLAAVTCLAVLLVLFLPAMGARAQKPPEQIKVSEDAAVTMVREQTEGKVIRVDRDLKDGAVEYRIRVLSPDGRLREYRVDAATGAIR